MPSQKSSKSSLSHNQAIDYLVLVALLLSGFLGFLMADFQRAWQISWIILTAAAYVAWGVWHHQRAGNFHWEVIVEYVLMALLAIGLVATLIFS